MAIDKNFVVKNGLEVNTDLILANAYTGKVGIATTNPGYDLHVNGGIGATDVYVSGIATVKTNLVLNGLLTVNASAGSTGQYLKSTSTGVEWASFPALRTSSSFSATTGQTTFSFAYTVGLLDVYINGVKLASAEFTASDGVSVVLANPCFGGEFVEIIGYAVNSVGAGVSGIAGITILEEGSITGNTGGVTSINFVGAAVTAVGTGAGVTVYITDSTGSSSQWETTSAGIHTLSNVGIGTTNPTSALTVKGNTSLETLNVSGVSTLSNVIVGGATTELVVNGDARITGILTIGTASITIDGSDNALRVGSNATIDSAGNVSFAGIGTFGSGLRNNGPVGGAYYYEQFSVNGGVPISIQTRLAIKTTINRYFGIGSAFAYYLDDVEAPFLSLIPGKVYHFNQEDPSNETYQISFYTDEGRTNPYTTGVTVTGVAGTSGSYTEFVVSENTPSILYYEGGDYIGGQIQVVGASIYSVEGKWTLGANGTSDYTFTGIGFTETTNDPVLYLARGKIYEFVNNSGGAHPFEIRVSNGGVAYNDGVTNNSAATGTIRFEIPMNAPNTLYYQCTNHVGMGNTISVYPSLI